MRKMEVVALPAGALRVPDYVDVRVLAANTAELHTVPAGASFVNFSANVDFYAAYIADGLATTVTTNGAFASDTGWTKGTGWTIAAGVATSDASQTGNSDLSQTVTGLVEGASYLVTFTVTAYTAGNIAAVIGGGTAGTNRASAATFAETLIAGSDGTVLLRADLDFAGSVDNLTVARVAIVPGADVTTGGGVELNPATRYLGTRTGGIDAISLISPNAGNVTMAFYTV